MANEEAIIFARVFRNGEVSGFIGDRRDVFGGIHWHLLAPSLTSPPREPRASPPPPPAFVSTAASESRRLLFNDSKNVFQWLQQNAQKRSTRFGVPFCERQLCAELYM